MDNPNLLDNSKEVEVPTNLTCEICIEPMTHINKFKNLERCVHPFCRDCIAKYIEAKVEERVAEVPCPSLNCEKLLDPLSCRRIIPAGLFEKWCDLLCESAVLRCKSAYCPFVNCLVLILNECGGNITRSKCPNCKKLLCFQCKLPWHAGFGCDETGEMRNENDILFGKLVERNKWKICPGCKYRVERNKGCQNIKCRCGVLFCYTCGKIKNSCECCRRIVMVEAEEQDGHMRNGGGVNGLADAFILLGMAFESPELNKDIFETIYYHALKASCELATKDDPYKTYHGSPVSKGILQPDMWGLAPSDHWDWSDLREMISKNGVINSLLVAPMPTASTSQILGNNECFEPYTSNIYSRRVLSGEFVVVNKHLLHDLTEMGLWSPALKNNIIYGNGSVLKIPEIPDDLKAIYKTVWEIKQKTIVDMAVDRGCFIDQSQSLNIHMDQRNFGKLTSLHFYAWSKGLKTGMYYLRSRAAADAIQFTVDTSALNETVQS
ncbi:hypothetical protein NE237_027211 [Protea cynaroides]|uniref:Uncharacterized protein n=1 Tax=Protea cynaroides TaxID=273540 RepID=A0A9Q0GRF0_9MAGN|nr:hypothetical protein NE237_027211 [Protea cynaroides]